MASHIGLGAGVLLCLSMPARASEPLAGLSGDMPQELSELIKEVIGTAPDNARSFAQAKRRAEKAKKAAQSALRSQGYYGGQIQARVIEAATGGDDDKRLQPQAMLEITAGPQFTFSEIAINYADGPPDIPDGVIALDQLNQGAPALAAPVVAAELKITNALQMHGYPDAKALEREAIVDHNSASMQVRFHIETGQKTRFGEIQQTGSAYLVKSWPKMVAPFSPGDTYDAAKINTLAARVVGTGVFESATAVLETTSTPNPDGTVTRNVLLNIEQGAINTVSGELGYSTTGGSGLTAKYERRNFIGYAQTLTLTGTAKTNKISFGADYNIPFAWRVDRELDFGGEVASEDTDAFQGERISLHGLLTQKLNKRTRVGLGAGIEASRYQENGQPVDAYVLHGLGRALYDTRNNIFDPERGHQLELALVPSYNFGEADGFFTSAYFNGSTYRRVSDKIVLAGRAKLGTIFGGSLDTIPLNRRYYAGGGGSVRGFGYQTISPTNASGTFIGGRSISELSGEVRYKGSGPIGFAGFIDAGSVTQKELPDYSDIRIGAGLGLRYYTSFAPLRADIAVPVNKRDGDSPVQIYLSIGQAF